MDLKLFLEPVGESLLETDAGDSSFRHNCHIFGEEIPDLNNIDIAIIGVDAGSDTKANFSGAPHEVRKKLYRLARTETGRIGDLGNLQKGVDAGETNLRLKEVCEYLINKNILPIIIGGSHDLDIGMYRAYENMEKMVSLIVVDAWIDLKSGNKPSQNHIEDIILHKPNYLFNYSHLAHQSYLVAPESLSVLEKLYFETYRVGTIHENIKEMEPVIREGDMLSFDMKAIRAPDFPASAERQPFGLSADEACQLCWYAGLSEKLSSIGFFEYSPQLDNSFRDSAFVLATMIWYFIEGFNNRKDSQKFTDNDYIKYVVSMPSSPETIEFYKSKNSGKWWIQVPIHTSKGNYSRDFIIPCTYSDYTTATEGEVPDRYVNTQARLH